MLFEAIYLGWTWFSVSMVVTAYLVVWLGVAYRRYLQLPHAWWVAVASVALGMLTGMAFCALLPGGLTGLMWPRSPGWFGE